MMLADIVVLLQAHAVYDLRHLANVAPLLLDTRGVIIYKEGVERL